VTEPEFDTDGVFDDDYLYFFAGRLEERSDAETEMIWTLAGLEAGMEVLDLACGHGRIANRLAQRGCRVTGLDATTAFLRHARQDAQARGVTVEYVQGDMRELPWRRRFDRIINWYTAFGYFDDAGNQQVLAQAAAALQPGGRLAMEMNNYARLVRDYTPATAKEQNGDLVVDQQYLDPLTSRSHVIRTVIRDGRVRQVPFFVRLFTFPELRGWLHTAGFTAVSGYGEDGNPLTAEHRRMITIARC
jgi:2-polyprenyl-3-methyl-5-hydroxy-6-metoxy-1,4-benzoquinol methylase